ncbi:hypothetical protein [Bacillus cereus]
MFYLSVTPKLFEVIYFDIQNNRLNSMQGWKRLITKKLFGYDLESGRKLNSKLTTAFHENEIYCVDYYLWCKTLRF